MKVFDAFSGLGGWSQPFRDRGHEVITLDLEPAFECDLVMDILEFDPSMLPWTPDLFLASPPCEGFSVMTIGRNWTKDHKAKTAKATLSLAIVEQTAKLVADFGTAFILENPRGKLRKLTPFGGFERKTVTYCQYGEERMKPTDLWGSYDLLPHLDLRPPCSNGSSCHVRAPRGSRNSTQGMSSAEAARVPYELALAVCLAAEVDLVP